MIVDLLFSIATVAAENPARQPDPRLPSLVPEPPYVASAACRECHAKEHASWHRSYHRTMTQVARPGTVAGKFDGSTVASAGLSYRVYQKDGELRAEMPDPDVMMYVVQGGKPLALTDIPRVHRPVVMTTGSHNYQTYWVASERYPGLLQTLPLVYLIKDQRWVPREAAFLRGHADQDRLITQWNHHCIRCHSTAGNPGLDEATGMLRTRVAELGISCEACHGPGQAHVEFQRQLQRLPVPAPGAVTRRDTTLVNPARLDHKRSSQVCGQCHGVYVTRDEFAMRFAREGPLYRPGDDLNATRYYVEHPGAGQKRERAADLRENPEFFRERWWDDGTILAGGREYTGLLASACHTKGEMSCLSCHSMHRSDPVDQLKPDMDGPAACVKCHAGPKYTSELARHTFHAPGSTGSNCLNCHMPHTSYALFKAIRSHQISSPKVAPSARFGTPNACNLCHLDRTLAWTQQHLVERYQHAPVALTVEQEEISAAVLWWTKGHAAQRVIGAWHLGWGPAQAVSGAGWLAPHAAQLLQDPYGVVRYVAGKSLGTLPGFSRFEFDFLAAEPDLASQATLAARQWLNDPVVRPANNPALLIAPDGSLQAERMAALLRTRDHRSVTVKE